MDAEETFTVPGGLATLRRELCQAVDAAEADEFPNVSLQNLLRKPVFVSFLGFVPSVLESPTSTVALDGGPFSPAAASAATKPVPRRPKPAASDATVERATQLLAAFPASAQRDAARALGTLLSELRALDEIAPPRQAEQQQLRTLLQSARASAEEVNRQYYAKVI